MKRPHVVCHMAPSIDGRIVTNKWPKLDALIAQYERTAESLDGDAWMIGRVSMAPYAGKARVLEKLGAKFGIKRLLLEGGGKINGTLLAADLIDELSVLVAPVADGSVGSPSLFDAGAKSKARAFKLLSVEQRPGDLVWLRYQRAR